MFGPIIYRFVLSFAILFYLDFLSFAIADKISDKRLCGDRNCQTIISKARTLARHKPTDPVFLPFERGEMINIYSKSAGSRQDLWGGELNGRRGYFPRSFVREYKVENPNPQFVIDTEHHVPLEDRLRGTQAPSNPRTVRQDNRPQDTPQQPPTQQVNEQKEEVKESDNKTEEPADETDIGDETELADDEPENQNEKAGSQPESGLETNTDTRSPSSSDQSSDVPKTETSEGEKQVDSVTEDPTEIDETELNDDDDNDQKREDTEVDGTETDDTELKDDEILQDAETKENVDDKHEDGYIDIDKLPEDTSTDIEEEEVNLDAIKETLSTQDNVNKEQEVQESEQKEKADNMQEKLDGEGEKKEDNDGDKEKIESSDKKEGETEIEGVDNIDEEGGSMFGSIWSDNSEGKIEENEGIDINNLTHSEHAVDSPNPDINFGEHIDKDEKENINYGDGNLHVYEYNGHDKSLENKDNGKQDDSQGEDIKIEGGKDQIKDIKDEMFKDDNVTENMDNNNIDLTEKDSTESDSELIEDVKENNETQNIVMTEGGTETISENQRDNSDVSENNKEKDDDNEDDDFEEDDDEDDDFEEEEDGDDDTVEKLGKDVDLLVTEKYLKDTEQKQTASLESEARPEENLPEDPDDHVDSKENGNVHLKDILKSSIPEGNDVHKYVVEHAASDTQVPVSESLGTDSLSITANQKDTRNNLDEVQDSQNGERDGKLEIVYGDGVKIGESLDGSNKHFDSHAEKEISSGSRIEDKDLTSKPDDLTKKDEVSKSKDNEELTDNRENENADEGHIDGDGIKLASDNEIEVEDTSKVTGASQDMNVSNSKDAEASEDERNTVQSQEEDTSFDIEDNKNIDYGTSDNEINTGGTHNNDKSMGHMNSILNNNKTLNEAEPEQNKDLEKVGNEKKISTEVNEDGSLKSYSNEIGASSETRNVGIEQNVDVEQNSEDEKIVSTVEDEREHVEDTGDKDEAVVSPFQKTDDSKKIEEKIAITDTEGIDNTVVEDEKSGDMPDVDNPAEVKPQSVEGNVENAKFEAHENTVNANQADVNAEQVLDNFERTFEAMADIKGQVKDVSPEGQENVNNDLKFVDSHGDVIQEQVEQQKENIDIGQGEDMKVIDPNVNEMEQGKEEDRRMDDEGQQVDANSVDLNAEQRETDDKKLENFEKFASGMMSILATPSFSESETEFPSSLSSDSTVVEEVDMGQGSTQILSTEAEMTETKVSAESVTQTIQDTESAYSTLVQDGDENEPIQDDTRGGGVVIDGTTFDADYFGDEMTTTNVQATEQIHATPSVVDNMLRTPLGNVKPTKLFDAPLETEQTMIPHNLQGNADSEEKQILHNQQNEQTTTFIPENIQASETVKEEPVGQDTLEVSVLGTSFGYATQKVEETHTQPIDSVTVDSQTQAVNSNETVASDIVQDMVQPSLDQNAYNTEAFISRKPLSTEPASAEASAETGIPNQGEISTNSQQVDQGEANTKQDLDQNNNQINDETEEMKHATDGNNNQLGQQQEGHTQPPDLNNNIPDNVVRDDTKAENSWTDLSMEGITRESSTAPTSDTPEQLDPYSSVEHLYSRKIPDPGLDEEFRQPDDGFMKTLEPYLKAMINMLPPSLQTVLEQEPLGLSPTVTMLVCLVSTNILGLLTCAGCMCKGKKKHPGRKDPIVIIRELEEKLFITTKEKENLEDDIQLKNKKFIEMQEELSSQQSSKGTYETDLKTIKLHNESLKKQLAEVQEELEEYKQEVTEKSQVVVYKDSELQTYLTEIESLTKRAEDAELAAQKTSQSLSEKNEELRHNLQQIQSLSEQIQQLETSKEQLNTQAVDWSEKVKDLTEQVEQFSTDSKRMQEDLAFKENELEVLRDCFLQVKAFQGEEETKEDTEDTPDLGEKLKQMMDVSRVNASLRSVEEERDVLQNKLLIEVESRKELEDQVQLLKRKFESNQTDKMKAERQCQEAQTKLEVLSKYFKEKEAELTRQLGEQEVLKNQNISKLQSSDSITQELSKENETYRQQIEDLKTEITKAERDFRSQIAANEKKAHENWLATRAAERELKESRHECGMLRQKLTDLERKLMQGPPPGLIRPITHRAMPPPGMLNGPPPPPPPERPGSRGSVHGHVTPRLRDDDYRASPIGPDRMPPPDRRHPPGPMGPRPPPPPLDAMSPPPYAIRPPFPPDRRSPPSFDRYPPPRGPRPPFPRPPLPHLRSPPPMGSNPSEHDDSKQDPYNRAHPGSRDRGTARHQSQV